MLSLILFSTAASFLLVLGTLLVDRALREQRRPTRWVWAVAMTTMIGVTLSPVLGGGRASPNSASRTNEVLVPPAAADQAPGSVGGGEKPSTPPAPTVVPLDPSREHGWPLDLAIAVVWMAGSLICLAILGISAWRISRMRRNWRPAVVAGVPVLVSHDVGPAIVGLVHHGVVVPGWVESLGPEEQRLVLAHEREHVRVGDPMLLWGATLLAALLPWNLPMWFALRNLRHAIEMDCDARVLRSRPDPLAYCTLLVDVGERTLAGVAPIAALAEPASLLERRVNAMTALPGSGSLRLAVVSMAAGLVLIAGACASARSGYAPVAELDRLRAEIRTLREANDGSIERLATIQADSITRSAAMSGSTSKRIDSSDIPADSIARRLYPKSYEPHDKQIVIGMIFSSTGKLLRHGMRIADSSDVFETGEQYITRETAKLVRAGEPAAAARQKALEKTGWATPSRHTFAKHGPDLLEFVFGQAPRRVGQWAVMAFRDDGGPALVWTVLPRDTTGSGPRPAADGPVRAIVYLKSRMETTVTDHGSTGVAPTGEMDRTILVYSSGFAAFAAGADTPLPRRDTLRVKLQTSLSLDLSMDGEVHFVSEDRRPFSMGAMIVGGRALEITGNGKHLVMMSGGVGVRIERQ